MIPSESIIVFWNVLLGGLAIAIVTTIVITVIIVVVDKLVIKPEYKRRGEK